MGLVRERRLGKFKVSREALDDELGAMIFAGMVPVRVEWDYAMDHLEVTALAPQFDPVKQFEEPPSYCWEEVAVGKLAWSKI